MDAYVFPDDFQLCDYTAENLDDCLLSALQDALPKLADPGISSPIPLKTEPIFAPYCEYHLNNPYSAYDEYFYNLSHVGFIDSTVLDVTFNTSSFTLYFTTFTPHLVQYSNYSANGTVRYNGTQDSDIFWGFGPCEKHIYNFTIDHRIVFGEVAKNEEEYLQVVSYNTTISLTGIEFDYKNLYNGTNPELAEKTGSYVNATSIYVVAFMQTDVQNFLARMFQNYTEAIVGSVPLSNLTKLS
ncbi:hypothetical protein JTB14_030358 [Gonioctena quinquepunctata]|nr:hypothetical protein JTB14_030358 [Gonioctena quinquepunctata]